MVFCEVQAQIRRIFLDGYGVLDTAYWIVRTEIEAMSRVPKPLISKLISLIKEKFGNTVGKANLIVDSGANQHLAYSDKFLVNDIDISKFEIEVLHPNGTEALITEVRNIVLTKYITQYDVLVVPEYCVSLMFVHKVARDSKLIVAFNESHFFVLPQGLSEMKCQGIEKQKDGLHYFDETQVRTHSDHKFKGNPL
nr:ribonuclease H-like domain-containing protein [Tanacetum cinerariifolium]